MSEDKKRVSKSAGPSGAIYGFGFIGAAIYFIQHAESFWFVVPSHRRPISMHMEQSNAIFDANLCTRVHGAVLLGSYYLR